MLIFRLGRCSCSSIHSSPAPRLVLSLNEGQEHLPRRKDEGLGFKGRAGIPAEAKKSLLCHYLIGKISFGIGRSPDWAIVFACGEFLRILNFPDCIQ